MQQTLVYWRDIPSQVIVKKGRDKGKAMLSERYQEAIDRAAMRAGKGSSDLYMEEWRREVSSIESDLSPADYAKQKAMELENSVDSDMLSQMIKNKGFKNAR